MPFRILISRHCLLSKVGGIELGVGFSATLRGQSEIANDSRVRLHYHAVPNYYDGWELQCIQSGTMHSGKELAPEFVPASDLTELRIHGTCVLTLDACQSSSFVDSFAAVSQLRSSPSHLIRVSHRPPPPSPARSSCLFFTSTQGSSHRSSIRLSAHTHTRTTPAGLRYGTRISASQIHAAVHSIHPSISPFPSAPPRGPPTTDCTIPLPLFQIFLSILPIPRPCRAGRCQTPTPDAITTLGRDGAAFPQPIGPSCWRALATKFDCGFLPTRPPRPSHAARGRGPACHSTVAVSVGDGDSEDEGKDKEALAMGTSGRA